MLRHSELRDSRRDWKVNSSQRGCCSAAGPLKDITDIIRDQRASLKGHSGTQ